MVEFAGQVGDPHRPLGGAIWAEEEGRRRAGKLEMAGGQDVETVSGIADVVPAPCGDVLIMSLHCILVTLWNGHAL